MQTFRVKLKLNKQQEQVLKKYLLSTVDLYNTALEILLENSSISSEPEAAMLYQASDLPTDISQPICKRARNAVVRYKFQDKSGKKFGKPRYKVSNKIKGESFVFPVRSCSQNYIQQFGSKVAIRVPRLGKIQGLSDGREILGTVKQVAIKLDHCDQFWATVVTDNTRQVDVNEAKTDLLGVDLGLKHTVSASNISGTVVVQPDRTRFTDKALVSLKFASNNDRKALPYIHRKIARRRQDNNWKLATLLVNITEVVAVGDVSPRWLMSGRLARSAADAGISDLKSKISYLAESAGRKFVVIPEAYTTKTCSCCGKVKKKVLLSERVFQCECGFSLDRDLNAARNIAKRASDLAFNSKENYGFLVKNLPIQASDFSQR